jgi:hypothetical protein
VSTRWWRCASWLRHAASSGSSPAQPIGKATAGRFIALRRARREGRKKKAGTVQAEGDLNIPGGRGSQPRLQAEGDLQLFRREPCHLLHLII